MSTKLSLEIRIKEGTNINFNQESTFENFISQFQQYCEKLLCVIDGTSLNYYDKNSEFPINIKFDYKQKRGELEEYYFRDTLNETLYCVFGRDNAKIFYKDLDIIDPIIINTLSRKIKRQIKNPIRNIYEDQNISINGNSIDLLYHNISNGKIITNLNEDSSFNKSVIIIDKGEKILFSNLDYPIEIKTYYPENVSKSPS